jgi:hypothetical protein
MVVRPTKETVKYSLNPKSINAKIDNDGSWVSAVLEKPHTCLDHQQCSPCADLIIQDSPDMMPSVTIPQATIWLCLD